MDRINFQDERVISLLAKAEEKSSAQRDCINSIDLSAVTNENLGENKFLYDKCMLEKGYGRDNFTSKNTYTYNI